MLELVIVVVIIAIIGSIATLRVTHFADKSKYTHVKRFMRDIKLVIDKQEALNGDYPEWVSINGWFDNHEAVRTPYPGYLPGATFQDLPGATHPSDKVMAPAQRPYWYNNNNNNGAFRVRVIAQPTTAETLALYNELNASTLTDLSQTID